MVLGPGDGQLSDAGPIIYHGCGGKTALLNPRLYAIAFPFVVLEHGARHKPLARRVSSLSKRSPVRFKNVGLVRDQCESSDRANEHEIENNTQRMDGWMDVWTYGCMLIR